MLNPINLKFKYADLHDVFGDIWIELEYPVEQVVWYGYKTTLWISFFLSYRGKAELEQV
jgi:hypothetical protein